MKTCCAVILCCIGFASAQATEPKPFIDSFSIDKAELAPSGKNPYFILKPGYQLVLKGTEQGKAVILFITVLKDKRLIDGVETRVVEERKTENDRTAEVSRNYFAVLKRTHDLFCFGEDVDVYKDGKIVSHEGTWHSGTDGARFGLVLPGNPTVGARYQQELAPGVAMDRTEIVSLSESISTPAGHFDQCLKTEETSPLEKGAEYKVYAPGIGIVQDNSLVLITIVSPHWN